jgi:ubiquinone/menaquinone biosynthesis C-methylase UbiE
MNKNTQQIKNVGNIYDKIADAYSKLFFTTNRLEKTVNEFLTMLPENAKILDVGCGPGGDAQYFIEKGFKVVGIDVSKEMLRIAKRRVQKARFEVMDMRNLSFESQRFDGIFAAYSLIHIPKNNAEGVLREFHRVLKPSGLLFLSVYEGNGERFVDEPLLKGERIFTSFFTQNELKHLLLKSGFRVLKMEKRLNKTEGELSSHKIHIIAQKPPE